MPGGTGGPGYLLVYPLPDVARLAKLIAVLKVSVRQAQNNKLSPWIKQNKKVKDEPDAKALSRFSCFCSMLHYFVSPLPKAAYAQDVALPAWPKSKASGCVGFCAQITQPLADIDEQTRAYRVSVSRIDLDPKSRGRLSAWLTETALLDSIAADRNAANMYKGIGFTVKSSGEILKGAGSFGGKYGKIAPFAIGTLLTAGGEYITQKASTDLQIKIIAELDKTYSGKIIQTDGSLNTAILKNIHGSDLRFVTEPSFSADVGDSVAIAQFFQKLNTDQLAATLEGIDRLGGEIKGVDGHLQSW